MKKRNYILFFLALVFLFNTSVNAECLIGSDTAKDLYGILKIFRIAAPLIVVFVTVVETIMMLASGLDPDKGGKEAPPPKAIFQKFVKRLIATLILFILPTLVDLVFQVAGIWDEDHSCATVLTSGETETETTTTTDNCAQYIKNQASCEAAGCSYNTSTKRCTK